MIIKEISTQHPSPNNYFIRDLKREYESDKTKKIFFKFYEEFKKSFLDYLYINKKSNLLDFVIIEED